MFHRANRSERGAAAVEMALVLPVLILLIGGIVDFGRAYYTQIILTNAAREGARGAIVLADPVARAEAAGKNDIPGWQTPVVANRMAPTDPWSVNSAGCTGITTPDAVRVTTSATFNYTFLGFLPGLSGTKTLSSNAVMGC